MIIYNLKQRFFIIPNYTNQLIFCFYTFYIMYDNIKSNWADWINIENCINFQKNNLVQHFYSVMKHSIPNLQKIKTHAAEL